MPIRSTRLLLLLCIALTAVCESQAATFYVRNGGDDSADGRSHGTAWASLGRVAQHKFGPGDQILLHSGDTWSGEQLRVDWSGTVSNYTVIGAYHLRNGVETRGVSGSKPTISGGKRLPRDRHQGLIEITGDYVRIENLTLVDSGGRGVSLRGADFAQVVNMTTRGTYDSGIKSNGSRSVLVENCFVTDSNRAHLDGASAWGAAIVGVESPRFTVRGSTVTKVYGEGINANHGSHESLIEGNRVFGARALGIYVDASRDVTIRRNMVLGISDPAFWRSGDNVGSGIVVNNEKYHYKGYGGDLDIGVQSTNVKVYANLVAYTQQGIAFWGNMPESRFDGAEIYNNTLVDNTVQFDPGTQPKPGASFSNNILMSVSPGTRDVARTDLRGMSASNNYLSQGDPGGDFSHPGNRYSGLELVRMRGWREIDDLMAVTWADFAPKGSAVTGAGDSGVLARASAKHDFDRDFRAKPHNQPIDIGAVRSGALKVPKPPGGLSVRPR